MSQSNERAEIVREELWKLVNRNLISKKEFKRLMTAYNTYQHAEDKSVEAFKNRAKVAALTKHIIDDEQEKLVDPPAQVEMNQISKQEQPVKEPFKKKETPKKPVRVPKNPEQVREKNITWLLVLGVAFLLISGLVVATSTWDQMGPLMKVIILLGVSVFFLGLSGISSRFLKIEKTAFAFLTLGSLLLPIAIIGIGYFGLFGDYLSLTGEGRYLLGLICTLVPLPLYARNAFKTKSKLFVWIFFLFLSFSVGFTLADFNVPVDAFFLLIMVFNAGLLYLYHRYHKDENHVLHVFLKELPAFAQLNLIISTLLMLFIFDEAVFYSFNVLITALLYMVMVFVYETKGYQFVFVTLFAYGIYQLTENSVLHSADFLVYALMGVSYLAFAYLMRKNKYASKIFYYTSGIVSGFAFIYITYQGLLSRVDERSWLMLLSYLVIAGTYVYLAQTTKRLIFSWLAPFFIIATGIQFWFLAIELFFPESLVISLFILGLAIFLGIGYHDRLPYLKAIQKSTYFLSIALILLMILTNALVLKYIETAIMLAIVGVTSTYIAYKSTQAKEKLIAEWIQPISWILALYILYGEIANQFTFYREELHLASHLALSGLILLGASLIWKKSSQVGFAKTSFYTGQISYLLAIYELLGPFQGNEDFVRPAILLGGIGVTYWLVRFSRQKPLWALVALISSGFYLSLLTPLSIDTFNGFVWFMLGLPTLFLIVEHYLGKFDPAAKPYFFYFAHGILAILVTLIATDRMIDITFIRESVDAIHPTVWLVPLIIYLYTTLVRTWEVEIKISLYAGMSMFVGAIISFIDHYQLMNNIPFIFAWIVAIGGLTGIWLVGPHVWKRRMDWYLIPFTMFILSIATNTAVVEVEWQLAVVIGLIILSLFFLHRRNWSIFNLFPLYYSLSLWQIQLVFTETLSLWLLYILGFVLLVVVGRSLYNQIWSRDDANKPMIDWYTIFAVPYLLYGLSEATIYSHIWLEVISLILLAGWFFLQANRMREPLLQKVFITLGGLAFLPPYYLVLNEYLHLVTDLLHAELRALPILALAIILTNTTWQNYKHVIYHVQTILLVGVTVYLIADAIGSGTIWDALIIGTLSIISLLAGMRYQIKSYFFVGVGTLLFNVIYQVRDYWGNLPWWAYLLFAGLLFIAIASYNEWKKQREDGGQIEAKVKKVIARFKEWD